MTPQHKAAIVKSCQRSPTIGRWKRSEATLETMSEVQKGILTGERNGSWKGEKVGYHGIHRWVYRWLGKPKVCTACGKVGEGRQMHWANVSGNYQRDLNDWRRLCAKCHKNYDLGRTKV